jgi:hypothetical protein
MRVAAVCAVAFLVVCVPSAMSAPPEQWDEYIVDAQGDSAGAPDIETVTTGMDDDGMAHFSVYTRIPSTDTKSTVTVYLDTDGSATTGDPAYAGAEYSFVLFEGGRSFDFERWSGGRWVTATARGSWSYRSPYLFVTVTRAALGNAAAVNVIAESASGKATDRVPDTGTVRYNLTPLKLTVSSFRATRSPRHERLELSATRSDTGGPFALASPYCHGRVGGKVVFATTFGDPKKDQPAFCAWTFAKALVGKKARLTITFVYAGRKASRSVSITIR